MIYRFPNGVVVEVWLDEQRLETRFADGSRVPAIPHDTAEYLATATDCGYTGPNARWQLCHDHELTHNWLALERGEISLTLWLVAHGAPLSGLQHATIFAEESQVLKQQYVLGQQKPWEKYADSSSSI